MNPLSGWICPRCHIVNAPDARRCDCLPDVLSPYVPLTGSTGAPMRCATRGGPFWVCRGEHTQSEARY